MVEDVTMSRTIAIGTQDFGELIRNNCFYVDKTNFIKEWWESYDMVTLVNRPRRFGKTLNMSMLEHFFSINYADEKQLFSGLNIWNDAKYRDIQGKYPVIFLSFAKVKERNFDNARKKIYDIIIELYDKNIFLLESNILTDNEKDFYKRININMDETDATEAINKMSGYLARYYGKKTIIILDEYDTPMQEAYVYGFWDEASDFFRSLFNSTFKTNPNMERAIITGITRISKESLFFDFNNPKVITTTSEQYASAFGFTENEVFAALDEYGITDKNEVKKMYDGFVFGEVHDIYNPWSIINLLDTGKFENYWVNTSSNALINNLMRQGDANLKMQVEDLINSKSITAYIDEEVVYNKLYDSNNAVWSLMLAAGYLKVDNVKIVGRLKKKQYTLSLTNMEVESMLNNMIGQWFGKDEASYNDFIKALLSDNVKKMNTFMNKVALNTFSYFDVGNKPSSDSEPERFYHGFVLGLIVELADRYEVKSNRESGFGRYDVVMIPHDKSDKAFIFEFKVKDVDDNESTIEDTLKNAHAQIEEKRYESELIASGCPKDNIRKYGFAFEGKKVLIG
jgi:hypothetical protein